MCAGIITLFFASLRSLLQRSPCDGVGVGDQVGAGFCALKAPPSALVCCVLFAAF
jgi:hypothetical protein